MKRITYGLLVTAILSSACLTTPPATTRTPEITVTPLRPAATVDPGAATFEAMVVASATALKLTASPLQIESAATPAPAETGQLPYPLSTDGAQAAPTEGPFTPIPPAPIMGHHVALKDETIYCIGRAYGVLPAAIAQANGLVPPFNTAPGQTLAIPEVQWANMTAGPVCPPQFMSKYPGLLAATPTSGGSTPLTLSLSVTCVANCDTRAADFVLHIEPTVTGGVAPYTFKPGIGLNAQFNSMPFGHCSDVQGTVTVTSADGQMASTPWSYRDVACAAATPYP